MTHRSPKAEVLDVFYDPSRRELPSPIFQPIFIAISYLFLMLMGSLKEDAVPWPVSSLSSSLAEAEACVWRRWCSLCKFLCEGGPWQPKELWHYHTYTYVRLHTPSTLRPWNLCFNIKNSWLAYSSLMLAQPFRLWQTPVYEMPTEKVWIINTTWWPQDF